MREITSVQNSLVKKIAELKLKKFRQETGTFFLEGKRAVEEAVHGDWGIEKLFFTMPYKKLWEQLGGDAIDSYQVSDSVMAKMSSTENPQGIGAVVKIKPQPKLADFAWDKGLVLVLDGVKDPGNTGTIIRTADAAGARAVILLSETAELFNPKVVRSTMGSIFHLPVFTNVTIEELVNWCQTEKLPLWATALEGAENLFKAKWPDRTVLVMGSEAQGVSPVLLAKADKKVCLPMFGKAESLNVAVAAGVCLFAGPNFR
jgi:TrmH family RNA methyltransferase